MHNSRILARFQASQPPWRCQNPNWAIHGYPPRCLGSLGRSGRGFEICRTFSPAVARHGCHRGCPWNWGPIFWGCEGGHEIVFCFLNIFFGDLKKRSNDAKQLQIYDRFWRDSWLLLLACVWVGNRMTPMWMDVMDGNDNPKYKGWIPIGESHQKISKGCIQGEIGIISDGLIYLEKDEARTWTSYNLLTPWFECVFESISELSQVGVGPMSDSDTNKRQARSFHWEPSINVKEICGKGIVGYKYPKCQQFFDQFFSTKTLLVATFFQLNHSIID